MAVLVMSDGNVLVTPKTGGDIFIRKLGSKCKVGLDSFFGSLHLEHRQTSLNLRKAFVHQQISQISG